MHIKQLNLEVTRRCTLECEHCFRGDSQKINISDETLKNVFTNVKKIDKLVITGGEPLIAVNELEKMIELIKRNNVEIAQINLVTNGTILSSRVLKILKELSIISKLVLSVSFDIFHSLELEKKNLKQKRDNNIEILKEIFGAIEYGADNDLDIKAGRYHGIEPIGRAKNLNSKRLDEINKIAPQKYLITPIILWGGSTDKFENNILYGKTSIDVNGNIVEYGLSFEDEDNYAATRNTNINTFGFIEAINNFINNKEPQRKK